MGPMCKGLPPPRPPSLLANTCTKFGAEIAHCVVSHRRDEAILLLVRVPCIRKGEEMKGRLKGESMSQC